MKIIFSFSISVLVSTFLFGANFAPTLITGMVFFVAFFGILVFASPKTLHAETTLTWKAFDVYYKIANDGDFFLSFQYPSFLRIENENMDNVASILLFDTRLSAPTFIRAGISCSLHGNEFTETKLQSLLQNGSSNIDIQKTFFNLLFDDLDQESILKNSNSSYLYFQGYPAIDIINSSPQRETMLRSIVLQNIRLVFHFFSDSRNLDDPIPESNMWISRRIIESLTFFNSSYK
jgi:hypothetical protein